LIRGARGRGPARAGLILSSRSPRRRAILEQLGIAFRVVPPDVEELEEGEPRELVLANALRKARVVEPGNARVLGADTEVVVDGRILGKPRHPDEAEQFLRMLSGRAHEVLGGIALRSAAGERADVAVTRVRFRALGQAELDWYLASGEWEGKAGAYAIQGRGAALVEAIEGDYWNVVGLSVPVLLRLAPDLLA
jgi:septum formation protein